MSIASEEQLTRTESADSRRRARRRQVIRRRRMLALVAVLAILAICGGLFTFRESIWGPKFKHSGYELSRSGQSPYMGDFTVPLEAETWGVTGTDNVLITTLHDEVVYHPVNSAWYISQMLSSYRTSQIQEYLDRAVATAQFLVDGAETDDKGALWFPYHFSHDVGELRMGTPWYSGMAQGMMTSVFVNLFETTGGEEWKKLAAQTIKSFDQPKTDTGPWFYNVKVLENKKFVYYEEYPALADEQNAHVVNGHIYALYGLYDYYRITGDEHVLWLFDVGATSVRDSFGSYRNPGQPSWYAMTYFGRSVWSNPQTYHKGVIKQLQQLGDMTGDVEFDRQAELLFEDFN